MLMYSHTINNHLNLGMTKLTTTGKIVKVLQNFKYSFKIFFLEISQLKKKTYDMRHSYSKYRHTGMKNKNTSCVLHENFPNLPSESL